MAVNTLEGLQPEALWKRFFEISQIPRGSGNEAKVVEYIAELARKMSLQYKTDEIGNIVVFAPAHNGFENTPVVILQGHVDMVCEKDGCTNHDFENDPIKLLREGEWICAEGTTLGADNGIGVAAALAVLSDPSIKRGPVECLFTIDEETALTGASNLQQGFVTGKILLNLDSEDDGEFCIGCAGGIDTVGSFQIEFTHAPFGYKAFDLRISGLKGGHSGMEIIAGRANALKVLARVLEILRPYSYFIADIKGGSKRNAIPREAEAVILIDPSKEDAVVKAVAEISEALSDEFYGMEDSIKVELINSGYKGKDVFSPEFTKRTIDFLLAVSNGVTAMSHSIKGLVETSSNLATVLAENGKLIIGTSQRSSVESARHYIASSIKAAFELADGQTEQCDGYSAWQPDINSPVLKLSKEVYKSLFFSEPKVNVIHAGLECGTIGERLPGMDMVSFGPTIKGAHSPEERVHIPAVGKFYKLLAAILESIAKS